MNKYRCETGRNNGKYYKLIYDRRIRQQACDVKYCWQWRWFLWIGGNYEGDFKRKRDALNHLMGKCSRK
jgi:hypothetical protein